MSGPICAILPSFTAISRQSIAVFFGRTTRAFLITTSKDFSIRGFLALRDDKYCDDASQKPSRFGRFLSLVWCFKMLATCQHFRCSDQLVERIKIEHARADCRGGADGLERAVELLGRLRQKAHD